MKIGAEIAVARALSDLAHKLLHAAAFDVESMTHERAHCTCKGTGACGAG